MNDQRVQYVSGIDPLYQNIKKLLAGRFDTLIAGENVMTYKIKQMGVVGEVINVGVTDISANLYLAFSPVNNESAKYAEIFSNGIRVLKKSGKLDQILDRYELPYWK
jgi:polar amino acid transport system substrate-binding protein